LYQLVFQSGVPCGARASVLKLLPTAVYGRLPAAAPGAGLISHRRPIDKLNLGVIFHSSWVKEEKLMYTGKAAAVDTPSTISAEFVSIEDSLR
jgi:hypothetical protein